MAKPLLPGGILKINIVRVRATGEKARVVPSPFYVSIINPNRIDAHDDDIKFRRPRGI
jgi:hypothetical protein